MTSKPSVSISVGAVVAIENKRARVKFNQDAEGVKAKAPHGTEGTITRTNDEGDRAEVTTADGRKFWTSLTNLSTVALNGWERVLGDDDHSIAKAKKQADQTTTAEGERAAGVTLQRGDSVKVDGQTRKQKVFWVGACKTTGRQRYGAGKNSKGGPFWGYSDELKGGE